MQRDKMKAAIDTIYGKVFNEGRGDLLGGLVTGPYIQHNPMFPDGTDFIINFLKQVEAALRGQADCHRWRFGLHPCAVSRLGRQGNCRASTSSASMRTARFWEHWDVPQPVPDSANNQKRHVLS